MIEDINKELQMLRIAWAYCELGMRGEELAGYADISIATLGRRLRELRENKVILEAVFNLQSDKVSENLDRAWPYFHDIQLSKDLQKHIGTENIRNMIIVPSASPEDKKNKDMYINTKRVGCAAAIRLIYHLKRSKLRTIGIGYGRTLSYMVDETIKHIVSSQKLTEELQDKKLKWVPIAGHTLLAPGEYFSYSASILASKIAHSVHETLSDQLDLTTPMYIAEDFLKYSNSSEEDAKARKEKEDERIHLANMFVESIPTHRKIFGISNKDVSRRDPDSLISQMDLIITGIGGLGENGYVGGYLGTQGELPGPIYNKAEKEELRAENVVGDLCGPFVTRDAVDGFDPDSCATRVNRRFLGTKPQDLRWTVAQGRKKRTPGVMIVADSIRKAPAISSAISNGCVSELIIDSDLAKELARIRGI